MKTFFVILLLNLFTWLSPTVDAASSWDFQASGEGEFRLNKRKGKCAYVYFELKFKPEKSKLYLINGGYGCTGFSGEYSFAIFNVRLNQIYYKGELIGEYDHNILSLYFESEGFKLDLVKEQSGRIFFHERWMYEENGSDGIFEVKAWLSEKE